MPYTIVNGTNGNNFIPFQGIVGFYNQTLVNPYSGYTLTVTGSKNVNNAIYDGLGGTDTLSMTSLGDVLTLVDSTGTIMIKNIETINAGDDGDIVNLSHTTLLYGNVTMRGSNGDDLLWSNSGNDLLFGAAGDDLMDGGGGNDSLYGGYENDYLNGGAGADTLFGGAGDDTFAYHADAIWGAGNTLSSLGSAIPFAATVDLQGMNRSFDTFNGDAEDTQIVEQEGTDTLILTSGNDVLVASDTVSPTNGIYTPRISYIDIINAGDGSDIVDFSGIYHVAVTINGGNGEDILGGSSGNDTLNGESGNDRLFGSTGNDILSGGTGDDTYTYRLGDGSDTLIETSGQDTIVFGAGISLSTLAFAVDGLNLKITVGADTLLVQNHFAADQAGRIETLKFADDTTYDLGQKGIPAAPVANDDSIAGSEDTALYGNVLTNDTDANGDTLTTFAQTVTTSSGATVVLNANGTFSYTGLANFNGTDGFSYTVQDSAGNSAQGNVTLHIAAVNDTPVAVDDVFSGTEDSVITGSLTQNDTDVDGDTLGAVAQTLTTSAGAQVTINVDGSFSYNAASNYNGADSFSYTVTDGLGGSAVGYASITVGSVNDAPVAQDDAFTGNEDAVITGNILTNDTDVDGDTLSAVADTLTTANGGTVTINTDGTFSYAGAANFNGNDSFQYTVRDASGATDTANVLLAVASVNDGPVARDDSFSGLRNAALAGNLFADNGAGVDYDIDGSTLSLLPATITSAQGGTVTLNADGTFSYTGAAGFYGADSFDYTVLDGQGGSDTATAFVTIALDPADSIIGTEGAETINGTAGDDEIFGLGSNDTIKGQDGNDTVLGGAGDDILYGDDSILTGSTKDKVFADTVLMPNLKEGVNIANLRPKGDPARGISEGNLTVDYDATATITFRKGYAGYDNSFGSFGIAADGTIVQADMAWKNVKTAGINTAHQIDLPVGSEGGAFGFFIIADGNNVNAGYNGLNVTADGNLRFVYNYGKADARDAKITDPGAKISAVYNDGATVKVLKGNIYFTTERDDAPTVNKDGKVHVVSGLMDTNNLTLNPKKADFATKPVTITKNDITVTALTGYLSSPGDKIGIKSTTNPTGGDVISGSEALNIAFAHGAQKLTVSLSDIAANGSGIDFKVILNGDTAHPVNYEYVVSGLSGGKIDIVLDAAQFGSGLITAIQVSSVANSAHGTETFYLDNVLAEIPGGTDTNTLRIGFEDLYNMGDADYEDVLFDLDINPVLVGDIAGGNDILDGGAGNDTLYGEGGDDILVLGLGADHAFGGAGADVFALTLVDGLVDTIHDFKAGEGDVINLHDVLEGYDPLADDISAFVHLVQNGANTEIQINADGDAGGAFVTAALILGGTGGADLATLVSEGALVAHHSAL